MIQDKHLSGASAELFTAYKFSEAGYSIYFPFLTQSKDDLVVCKDGIFNKVQVKRATEITLMEKSIIRLDWEVPVSP